MKQITMKCPDRSPLCVAEALQGIIKGKTVCDVGCREGDMIIAFSQYADKVIGIDWNGLNVQRAVEKGLEVTLQSFADALLPIPKADVYYAWVSRDANLKILNLLEDCIVVLGGDPSVGEKYDIPGSSKISVKYNEGDGEREYGVFELTVIDKRVEKFAALNILNPKQEENKNERKPETEAILRFSNKKPDAVAGRVSDKPARSNRKGNRSNRSR